MSVTSTYIQLGAAEAKAETKMEQAINRLRIMERSSFRLSSVGGSCRRAMFRSCTVQILYIHGREPVKAFLNIFCIYKVGRGKCAADSGEGALRRGRRGRPAPWAVGAQKRGARNQPGGLIDREAFEFDQLGQPRFQKRP